jgi:predicted DNA-binding ArsR family transcriptional regulator
MANLACTQIHLAFQTLDDINQDIVKAKEALKSLCNKIKEVKEEGYKHIRTLLSLELNNLHWSLRNAVRKDERLNAALTNLELMG